MRAMVLERPKAATANPLKLREVDRPSPAGDEILIKVIACGICRTDLHVVEGELTNLEPPVIPGHQVVGEVVEVGAAVTRHAVGDRVGVPWLHSTCGECGYCRTGQENLCDRAQFTGYTVDGGFAEYLVAKADFSFALDVNLTDLQAAPLLCAGMIGYRSLKLANPVAVDGPVKLGLYGFGASAHIVIQMARHRGYEVYAFTRAGDEASQQFARDLGAAWAGYSGQQPPAQLDAAIIFAPVGALVPAALKALRKGGVCVCAGIHMTPIPGFHYRYLWGERCVRSVANLTREDGLEFLELAPQVPIETAVTEYPLEQANEALVRLKRGEVEGALVLVP